MAIHPNAIVSPDAEIHPEAEIAPYAIIKGRVKIGKGTKVDSFATIGCEYGRVHIGEFNHIMSGAAVGGPPQDLSYKGDDTLLEIGDHNVIRECVTINIGTEKGGGVTRIGNHCLLMAYVHVAHDCLFSDHVVVANATQFAGHIVVEDHVRIGGMSAAVQFTRIGRFAFVAGDAKIHKDVLPFSITEGHDTARARATNKIGLTRAGVPKEEIEKINRAMRLVIMGNRTIEEALREIESQCLPSEYVDHFMKFIRSSKVGIGR